MMNVADKEGYHRSMVSSFTEYTHSRNFFQTLQSISCQLGANAVIGVDLDYETVGGSGSMLMVTANGTAVKIEDD